MRRVLLAFEMLFQRRSVDDEDLTLAWERMSREIKGTIFALLTLFLLVSLTSYMPFDTFNLVQGRLDHITNLGGVVGAAISEWFLGSIGIMGFVLVALTAWLSYCAFRAISFRQNLFRVLGVLIAAVLGAITCQLFAGNLPEASLFQGGYVGKHIGVWLQHYFNTTGAGLIVGAGFVVTLILTTRLSVVGMASGLFSDKDEEADDFFEEEETPIARPKPQKLWSPTEALEEKKKSAAKKRRQKANKKTDEPITEESDDSEPGLVNEDEATEDGDTDEKQGSPSSTSFCELIPFTGAYHLPTTRLLKGGSGAKRSSRGELKKNAIKLCEHLLSFQITGEVTNICEGPVLTTYEYKPSAGVKLKAIAALQDDLGVILGTKELRIMAPIPGKTVVGIEVPRPEQQIIALKDVLSEDEFYNKKNHIPIVIGKSTDGESIFTDLAQMPHLLVAGATGSGKSVFINCLVTSLLYRLPPQQLRLILIDPKMLELNVFDGIPHLISKVITDTTVAFNALTWTVNEMERRYNLMAEKAAKNIDSYNSKVKNPLHKLPYIVVVVDELADLMLTGGGEVEVAITRLAQKARAAGIHLVIATQRPSTDVITGLIKANIPSRLSFKVPSSIDSRTILDGSGAEDLIGRGDMLMVQPATPLRRLHGCFITEEELIRVVKYIVGGKDYSKFYMNFG
ncbi:MAG: DNA translocase FtsK 4TM domain-containing protein [Deltaproteobacteria bacterium]|nr:DNA translocase FtsK 4TM domain-containing protein [Deltaproteobacteria bacterium]